MFLKSTDLSVQSSPLKVCFTFPCLIETFSDGKEEKKDLPQGLMENFSGIRFT